jgi:hypothetical protein
MELIPIIVAAIAMAAALVGASLGVWTLILLHRSAQQAAPIDSLPSTPSAISGQLDPSALFDCLVPRLVAAIPSAVAKGKPTEPLCIVHIYYYDTHAPLTYLTLRLGTTAEREEVIAKRERNAPFYLWSSGEVFGKQQVDIPADPPLNDFDQQITALFEQVYALLSESEDTYMPPFRRALQKVARQLNDFDWSLTCPVTDDFVVVPADGSQFFAGDDYADLTESVPAERLELLRSRRLLGPGKEWSQLQ